ncbi:MAG: peptidase S41 [Micavibrio aeruginosavorus]|uniref:Peptidase S41 n=1 Tax=Micavibrio aeruginosavorus TaxID=349221 RepID=A0A2W5FJV4_9BACT|nr:MAG: peptidase S41 [Micavibrio aeruginosavorus]
MFRNCLLAALAVSTALTLSLTVNSFAQEPKATEPSIKISPPVDDKTSAEPKTGKVTTDPQETYKQLNLFGDVFERVRAQYVDQMSDEQLIEYAVNGMLSSLDPHSSYLNEKDFDDMRVQTKGEFGGLGIEVTMEEGLVKVVSPIDDTPASKAGIKAGDYITHLDNKPILGMTLAEAVEKMRGKVGAPIEITVRREGVSEPLKYKMNRDVIKIKAVKSRLETDDIGYIRITTFNQNTFDSLKSAIEKAKKDSKGKLAGYVIDLRNNPGGLLDQAIAVSDAFLDKGEIVSTRGRDDKDIKRDNATSGDLTEGLPIVVLINGGSASAAEIVAGALQDHKRAIVMGTRSFGKGSVQTVIPLPGHGAMRLTTARYFTPSGRSIQGKGIAPDIIVEAAKIEKISEEGFHEEDLKGALANPDVKKVIQIEKKDENQKGETPMSEKTDSEDAPVQSKLSKESEDDYQIGRAIDLLHGLALYSKKDQ